MPPDVTPPVTGVLFEEDKMQEDNVKKTETRDGCIEPKPREFRILWYRVRFYTYVHFAALYGLYLAFTSSIKTQTYLFALLITILNGFGVTAGAHRYWCHRSYKAKMPLQIFLLICFSLACQKSIRHWVRDHRLHHKFSETDADPYNRKRGFFFSHVGWLMTTKHPQVKEQGKKMDFSDLENDPLVMFHNKYYFYLFFWPTFFVLTIIPVYFWGESWTNAWHFGTMFRFVLVLNITSSINSAAHTWGNRPYDKRYLAADNASLAAFAFGEGWHNYHHCFPWDYKTAELGNYRFNFATAFIDLMKKIGWAYDLKTVSEKAIRSRALKSGDGSHELWGWGDKDMSELDKKLALILNKKRD